MNGTEDSLIRLLVSQWTSRCGLVVGPGDDCAVVNGSSTGEQVLMKIDAIVEDVHFTRDMPAFSVGRKALARVISDFAAMGAQPSAALISISVPENIPATFLKNAYRGMNRLACKYHIALAGGETTKGGDLSFTVAAIGFSRRGKLVLRSGAFAGDLIFVTGSLGGSFPKHHLTFHPRVKEGLWLAENRASAMMDLSDGLGKDLPRLAEASNLSFQIHPEKIPRRPKCSLEHAVNDGEDYELLFTVSQCDAPKLRATWPFHTRLTEIGIMLPSGHDPVTGDIPFHGYDHFEKIGIGGSG